MATEYQFAKLFEISKGGKEYQVLVERITNEEEYSAVRVSTDVGFLVQQEAEYDDDTTRDNRFDTFTETKAEEFLNSMLKLASIQD